VCAYAVVSRGNNAKAVVVAAASSIKTGKKKYLVIIYKMIGFRKKITYSIFKIKC